MEMNSSDFEALMGNTFGNLTKLSASKGLEYSGETDRLANFKDQAKLLGFATPIQVLGVYLNKHLGSINKFIAGGTASSEPIEGRIDDAILYLVLLKALICEDKPIGIPMGITRPDPLYPRVHQKEARNATWGDFHHE